MTAVHDVIHACDNQHDLNSVQPNLNTAVALTFGQCQKGYDSLRGWKH